jgi:glycosyltransferase involved in cell wall biosynthesis
MEITTGRRIRFPGGVGDGELRNGYRCGCRLFLLRSRNEGFGLDYLEAMAGRKPVIAARATVDPEIGKFRECLESATISDDSALLDDPEPRRFYGKRGHEISTSLSSFELCNRNIETAHRELVCD